MKTKLEILNETVEYYSQLGRRALRSDGSCVYKTLDGRMCAVGRCMLSPEDYGRPGIITLCLGLPETLDSMLKPEYRGHLPGFWSSLQRLHDSAKHWNKDGSLSDAGRGCVEDSKRVYL